MKALDVSAMGEVSAQLQNDARKKKVKQHGATCTTWRRSDARTPPVRAVRSSRARIGHRPDIPTPPRTGRGFSATNLHSFSSPWPDSAITDRSHHYEHAPVINSHSHPLKVSWLAEKNPSNPLCVLHRIAMTSCPGKRLKLGRDGIIYERCLSSDIKYLSKAKGITVIVCLLSQSELSCLGINLKDYAKYAEKWKVEFIPFPVVEMAPFEDMENVYRLCEKLSEHLAKKESRVLIHCRGGMGRTGTLAACYYLFQNLGAQGEADTMHEKAIAHVRRYRSARAIESRKQEDCVRNFALYCEEGIKCVC